MATVVEKKEEKEVAETTSDEKEDEVVKAVAERLKFFFSDANIRQDRFIRNHLLQQNKNDPSGFVPLESLLRFNTIKKLTTDETVVIKAAKTLSDFLNIKSDNTGIGRVDPFTREKMHGNVPVTLCVSNLPITAASEENGEAKIAQYAVTIEEIRDLFTCYGDVAIVKLQFKYDDENEAGKKHGKKSTPNGAAMVEFENEETMQKASEDVLTSKDGVEVEPKRKLTLGDNTLSVISLKDFIEEKKKRKEATETKDGDDKEETKKRDRDDGANEAGGEEVKVDWKPRCVIELKGLSATCDREAILNAVSEGLGMTLKQVKEKKVYADFSRGQTDGAIRFAEPLEESDDLVTKLNSGDVKIDGAKVESAKVLDGDDEVKYWKNYAEFKKKLQRHHADERASKRRKGGGKRR